MKKIMISIILILAIAMFSFNAYAADPELSGVKYISVSLVNQDPDPAIAGDLVELRVGVENLGGESVQNLVIEMIPEYPFTLVAGSNPVQEIGSIKSYQEGEDVKIIKYKVKVDREASAGGYEVKFWEYEKGKKDEVKTQRSLSVDVKNKESAEVIYIDKTSLVPGKENQLKFTINNVGKGPLRDLKFSWDNDDKIILPVGSDNTKYVDHIDMGESTELTYRVNADADADPGLYELELLLEYEDSITGETKQISTVAGVYIGGQTDFEVSFSEAVDDETSFAIANIGSNPATSVSVSIPKQDGWQIKGSNSVIVGNLNKGDYTIAGFKIAPASSAQSTPLSMQIAYTDTSGERVALEKEVEFDSQALSSGEEKEASGRPQIRDRLKKLALIFGIGIVAFFGYRFYKKRKVKKK
jgi:hypothetical protein